MVGTTTVSLIVSDTNPFTTQNSSIDTVYKTSSVDAAYSDPDLLIREYFLSSLEQREISRRVIFEQIKNRKSVFEILKWGASGKVPDSYDGAVNLLAETRNLQLLSESCKAVRENTLQMFRNSSIRVFEENCIEILVKAIACAYKIAANQRLELITQVLPPLDNRMIKASIIDALTILSDEEEVNLNKVKKTIESYTSNSDPYIRDYARQALVDLG